MKELITDENFIESTVTVGIFWAAGDMAAPDMIFDSEAYPAAGGPGHKFINYEASHFEMWRKLAVKQCGGKYKGYDCYHFPRGRVLYDCYADKTLVYADRKILSRLDIFEPLLKDMFLLENYEFWCDEHYQSTAKWDDDDKLEYKILRGADKIGANILEITRGGTKILVEFGRELDNVGERFELTAQESEIISTRYNAAVISHYHGDHAENIRELKCPVYMGPKCKELMQTLNEYTYRNMPERVRTFRDGTPFLIGSVKVTPYLCDHSAMDSYMLLFEGGGKRILYTGDYRSGGRKDFEKLLCRLPADIDVLITEGTNLGRNAACGQDAPVLTEADLELRAAEIMKNTGGPVFVLQSSMNIDRLVSFYRAAKRTGRVFYTDDFQAQVCGAAGGSIPRPNVFGDVYSFMPRFITGERYEKFSKIKNKVSRAAIVKQTKYVMLVRCSHIFLMRDLNEKSDLQGATLIYSLWEGYKEKEDMKKFLDEIAALGIKIVSLHTSGHADAAAIARLIKHTRPKKIEYVHRETSLT